MSALQPSISGGLDSVIASHRVSECLNSAGHGFGQHRMTIQPSSSSGGSNPRRCEDCGSRELTRDPIRQELVCDDCGLVKEDPDLYGPGEADNAASIWGEGAHSQSGPLGSVGLEENPEYAWSPLSIEERKLSNRLRDAAKKANRPGPGEDNWKSIEHILLIISGWLRSDNRVGECKRMFFLFRGRSVASNISKAGNSDVRHCVLAHVYVEEINRDDRSPEIKQTEDGRKHRMVRWNTNSDSSDVAMIRERVMDHLGPIDDVTPGDITKEIALHFKLLNERFQPVAKEREARTIDTNLEEASRQLALEFDLVREAENEVRSLFADQLNAINTRLQEALNWVYRSDEYPNARTTKAVNLRKNVHAELIYRILGTFGIEVSRSLINPVVGASRDDGPGTKVAASIGRLVKAYYAALPTFNAMTEQVIANLKDEAIEVDHIRNQAMRGFQLMHQHPHYPYEEGASQRLNRIHLHCAFLNRLLEEQGHSLNDETRAAIVQHPLEEQDKSNETTLDEERIERILGYLNREMEI